MSKTEETFKKVLYQTSLNAQDVEWIKRDFHLMRDRLRDYRFSEYENWGIQYQPNLRLFEFSRLEDFNKESLLDDYLYKYNWRYTSFSPEERRVFFYRLDSIKYDALSYFVQRFIGEMFGDYQVSTLSVFGGVLYGHEKQEPEDIDLIVLLDQADFTANPVSMYIPNMEKEIFCRNTLRPVRSGKVGLTIIGTRMVNPLSRDEFVKEFSLVYWGEAVPIWGDAFCTMSPPPASILPHPYRLMAWAYKDLIMNQGNVSFIIRSLSRVIVGVYIALFIIEKLSLDYEIAITPKEIWESIYADPRPEKLSKLFVRYSHELSRVLFRLECIVKNRALEKLESIWHGY